MSKHGLADRSRKPEREATREDIERKWETADRFLYRRLLESLRDFDLTMWRLCDGRGFTSAGDGACLTARHMAQLGISLVRGIDARNPEGLYAVNEYCDWMFDAVDGVARMEPDVPEPVRGFAATCATIANLYGQAVFEHWNRWETARRDRRKKARKHGKKAGK